MNVTATSPILLSSSAGDGTAAPEGGEALSETGFAAHLLAQTLGEKPSALPKASTGAAVAQDEVENASAEPRLADPSLSLEQGRLSSPEESGRTLPPDLAARLQNAASPALGATPQAVAGAEPLSGVADAGAEGVSSTDPIGPHKVVELRSGETPLRSKLEAIDPGSNGPATEALQLSIPQSRLGLKEAGTRIDPDLAPALPGAFKGDLGLTAETLPVDGNGASARGQVLALPTDNLTPTKASIVAPVRQIKAAEAEGLRSSTSGTPLAPELAETFPEERGARLSEQATQGSASTPGLPASTANMPAIQTNANPVVSPTTASVSNAPQTSPQSSQIAALALDQVVEQIVEAREAGRSMRPELSLRTNDFGTVAMRIDASSGDWRATLSARDPGFVPAVQAALAERTVAATSESSFNQHNPSQRGDSQSHAGSQAGGGFGAAHGGNEQRYGSSTGSEQGAAQPYSGEEGAGGTETTARDQEATRSSVSTQEPDGARFA